MMQCRVKLQSQTETQSTIISASSFHEAAEEFVQEHFIKTSEWVNSTIVEVREDEPDWCPYAQFKVLVMMRPSFHAVPVDLQGHFVQSN
jgi:hypothetical protein